MKNYFVVMIFIISISALPVIGQERDTLFKGDVVHGGFGGPEVRITQLNDENNILVGGKGAWLVNHRFYLGGAGFGATKNVGDTDLDFGYGGIMLGYIFPSSQKFTFSTELIAGAGSVNQRNNNQMHMNNNNDGDTILVLEPAVYAQLNLTRFANINAGISYRLISDSDTTGLSNSNLSGLSAIINVMFGSF